MFVEGNRSRGSGRPRSKGPPFRCWKGFTSRRGLGREGEGRLDVAGRDPAEGVRPEDVNPEIGHRVDP